MSGPICHGCRLAGVFELLPGIASLTSLRSFELSGNASSLGDLWRHPTVDTLKFTPWMADSNLCMPSAAYVCMPALQRVSINHEHSSEPPLPPAQFFGLSTITSLQLRTTRKGTGRSATTCRRQVGGQCHMALPGTRELANSVRRRPPTRLCGQKQHPGAVRPATPRCSSAASLLEDCGLPATRACSTCSCHTWQA